MDRLDKMLEAARWYRNLQETNNDAFMPLFFDTHRYLVLKGGGGSGKSIFAGRKVLERVTTEPGHRWLVCRKVGRTIRDSCFRQLKSQIYDFYPGTLAAGHPINEGDMRIRFANGSEILFTGLDDVEKLKSIYNITGIWIEEASELLEADFNQLDIRLRGETTFYKQIILSFNPISITHWLKTRFFDREDPNARTHHSTYKDNRFLDADAIRVLESFRETDEYHYEVYCLGMWGTSGRSVFDGKKLMARLQYVQKHPPGAVGYFAYDYDGMHITNIRWVDDDDGYIRIYAEPEHGRPYVIGGDTAGDGSDSFVGQVIDNITGRQTAVLRHTFDEDVYARQMYCLGMYYNEALIGIESNFSTYPNKELERLKYRKLYVREVEDTFSGQIRKSFGFKTTPLTRPVIIAGLVTVVREAAETLYDETTILEMLTFVRNEDMRAEAEEGAHDDTVMALAIAHYVRPQQRMTVQVESENGTVEWSESQWQDYRRAGEEEREIMIRRWGKPKRR